MIVTHFSTAAEFRRWLERNHATAVELQVGFYRKASGLAGLTYREAVDEALCFGWIDGIIRKIDANRFTHRFTPRRTTSIWSNLNISRVIRLTKAGKMRPAGIRAFAARKKVKIGTYSFEQKKPPSLPPPYLKKLKADRKAWAFFRTQAPWYRRKIIHAIVGAKKETTRVRRLERALKNFATGSRSRLRRQPGPAS